MFWTFLPFMAFIFLPIFLVVVILGLVKKSKKMKLVGGFGCVVSILLLFLGAGLQVVYSESIRAEMIEKQEKDLEDLLNTYRELDKS